VTTTEQRLQRADVLTQFQVQGNEPLAKQSLTVRLPESADAIARNLPDRSEKLRQWILEGMEREKLIKSSG
jgi:hypothetical protein